MNPLAQLAACGQSPWLDFLKRSLVATGGLAEMIERDGLKGVTSNPSIFEKSIAGSSEYDKDIAQFARSGHRSVQDIYEHLAIADIQAAADVLHVVYIATGKRDGYISLECSPYLANDTQATVAEGERLWAAVNRQNLMVKVPATPAGIPAIRALIAKGINVNITLLFAVGAYEAVVEAYIAGLEAFVANGGDAARVASVASFFISRIDAAIDKQADALADKPAATAIKGKIAIANAKIAYQRYLALFSGPRWQALAARGAQTQRLLWASTGVKDPAYKDTLYVEALIGRDTVNTLPPGTMDAFRHHGRAMPDAILTDVLQAQMVLGRLEHSGISLDNIAAHLVEDGVKQFAEAFDRLFAAIGKQQSSLLAA